MDIKVEHIDWFNLISLYYYFMLQATSSHSLPPPQTLFNPHQSSSHSHHIYSLKHNPQALMRPSRPLRIPPPFPSEVMFHLSTPFHCLLRNLWGLKSCPVLSWQSRLLQLSECASDWILIMLQACWCSVRAQEDELVSWNKFSTQHSWIVLEYRELEWWNSELERILVTYLHFYEKSSVITGGCLCGMFIVVCAMELFSGRFIWGGLGGNHPWINQIDWLALQDQSSMTDWIIVYMTVDVLIMLA